MCVRGTSSGKCSCVNWCVYEIRGERNVTLYSDVCLWFRLEETLMLQWCVYKVQGDGNITEYSDVFLRYRVWEMTLCKMMCLWGTGWRKYYWVQWCVSEVQPGEMLLCRVICFWGTVWWKYYSVHWCVSEVQCELNVTVYKDLYMWYRVR